MVATVHLVDESAAFVLLAAVVGQCKKDLRRRRVEPEDRDTAYLFFDTILEVNDGAGTNAADARAASKGNQDRPRVRRERRVLQTVRTADRRVTQ